MIRGLAVLNIAKIGEEIKQMKAKTCELRDQMAERNEQCQTVRCSIDMKANMLEIYQILNSLSIHRVI